MKLCSNVADDDFIKGVFFCHRHLPGVVLYTENQLCDLKRCCGSATTDSFVRATRRVGKDLYCCYYNDILRNVHSATEHWRDARYYIHFLQTRLM